MYIPVYREMYVHTYKNKLEIGEKNKKKNPSSEDTYNNSSCLTVDRYNTVRRLDTYHITQYYVQISLARP